MDPFHNFNGMDFDYAPSPYSTASVTSSPFDTSAMKDMDLQPLDLSPPLDPPSREDWERFKVTILEQYVGMNMPVKDLVHHMELYYTFRATPRMFKQRFTEWGVFKYPKAAAKRMQKAASFTSAPAPQLSASPVLPHSTAMSRVSSNTSNGSMFSNPLNDDIEPYEPQYNNWACLQDGICPQSAVCGHRHCIQTVLSNLEAQQHQITPTSHPSGPAYSPSYNQDLIPQQGSVDKVIYYVEQFSESCMSPEMYNTNQPRIPDAAAQAARITSDLVGHCSHKYSPKQCERCTFAEFSFGLSMLEDGHADLAVASFELGCRLTRLLLSSPSKLFIRNLVMAFGSPRWKPFEGFRHKLLEYFALMAQVVLGHDHPITIILQNVACGDTLVASAEPALRSMIASFEKTNRTADPDVLLVKRSLSVVLRRQEEFQVSESLLLTAINDSEVENGYSHKETRRCLRRLGHLYMQQQRWDEAEASFMRILDTAPGRQGSGTAVDESFWIPDEISVYTYHHLAQLSSERGDMDKCRWWFSKELMAAIKRWGPGGEYTTECLSLAYNETPGGSLAHVVEQYPEILGRLEEECGLGGGQGRVVISKARWCAVRNLI